MQRHGRTSGTQRPQGRCRQSTYLRYRPAFPQGTTTVPCTSNYASIYMEFTHTCSQKSKSPPLSHRVSCNLRFVIRATLMILPMEGRGIRCVPKLPCNSLRNQWPCTAHSDRQLSPALFHDEKHLITANWSSSPITSLFVDATLVRNSFSSSLDATFGA